MGKRKRKRVSREDVRKNAQKGGGGPSWTNLPEGVRDWSPDKKGKYLLDVLPYVVSDEQHPDNVEKGVLWFKRIFVVHHNVGVNNASVVCPCSIGKRCPIHDERGKLLKDKDGDHEEAIKDLKGQSYAAFNIVDPDDDDKAAVFLMSVGKFWSTDRGNGGLKKELEEGDDDVLDFYHADGGKTVKARFSEDVFKGRKFLKVSKVDFVERKGMDEDEILEKVVDLDTMLNIMPYDKLKAMFLQMSDEGDDEKKSKKEDKGKKEKKAKKEDKKKSKKKAKPEPEPEPEPKKKDKKDKKSKKKKCPAGHKFGKHFDKKSECEGCKCWDACEAAN